MSLEVVLARYPGDRIDPAADFRVREVARPAPLDGEVLVEVTHLSMDPFPRMRMRADSRVGPPMALDRFVEGRGIGRVLESRHARVDAGEWVMGELGWRTHAMVPGDELTPVDLALGHPERHLSVIGPSGLTAYFTMEAGRPQSGETVVIAPAAGSVGVLAGQIAKQAGARVVGIGGGSQCAALTGDLGFDSAVDHASVADRLAAACPDGVQLFVDGVGGLVHDAVMSAMAPRGRVILLGFIAGYGEGPRPYGSMLPALMKRLRVEGFLLSDWRDRFAEAQARLAEWLRTGAIRPVETIWEGLEQAPAAFAALFEDAPPGKQIVRLQGGEDGDPS